MARATGFIYRRDGKRGSTWYAQFRTPEGVQIKRALGAVHTDKGRCPEGRLTKVMAEDALRGLLTDAERGTLAGAERKTGHTFADACEEFLRHRERDKGIAETTLRAYKITIAKTFTPHFGADTAIENVDEGAVIEFRGILLDNPSLSRNTARHHMILLFGVLERARLAKWIKVNPAADVERITIDKASGAYNVLSPVQVMALGRAAINQQNRTLYIVAAFTGLRMGELRALRWENVDYANAIIRVQRNRPSNGTKEKAPKSGKVRSVPLLDHAARELDGLSRRGKFTAPGDHVFINTFGGALHDDTIRREWDAAMTDAGLGHLRSRERGPDGEYLTPPSEWFTFHDLRHTFGTTGARMWPLNELQGYMGHAKIETTMVYVHHVPRVEAAREASAYIDAQLGAQNVVANVVANPPILTATESN